MNTELAILNYSPEQIEVLKNTVAQGASDYELKMFLEIAAARKLNPFLKEIWFIKGKSYEKKNGEKVEGRVQMMTGIDGFYRIANDHPAYDGIEHEYGPNLEIEVSSDKVGKKILLAPEYVDSIVFRRDRSRPERRRAYWREYAQELVTYTGQLSQWAKMPNVMLEKCADALALRKAFPQELGDFYAKEEMPREYSADEEERKTAAELEAQQRANFLKKQTATMVVENDYIIEHGSKKGSKASEATNSVWLEKHLEKYDALIPAKGKEIIRDRIEVLKREYARKLEETQKAEAAAKATPAVEVVTEPSKDEIDARPASEREMEA